MDSPSVRDLFLRALQFGPGDREEFLAGAVPNSEIRDQVLALLRKDQRGRRMDATNQALLGEVLIDAGRWQEARDALVEGEKIIDGLLVEDLGNGIVLDLDVSTLTLEAVMLHHGGRVEPARERCRKAFDAATTLLRKDPATEQSIDDLPKLRREARELGVPDPTAAGSAAPKR
jgi:hypothetical protein